MREIVIIGGGASGLVCAIKAKNESNKVTILERNDCLGKKILVTGNGRCNYFNENQEISNYYSSNRDLLEEIITKENTDKVIDFFNELGIIPRIKNGYYYPFSNQASTIREALVDEVKRLGIEVVTNCFIEKVKRENNRLIVYTDNNRLVADELVLSVGSQASISKMFNQKQYNILRYFSHHLIEPLPALTPLITKFPYLNEWNGVRSEVYIRLMEDGEVIGAEEGEIQLTNYGISGICVFNLSGLAIRGLYNKKEEVMSINFLPFLKEKNDFLNLLKKYDSTLEISKVLDRMLNYKLVNTILKYSKISNDKKVCNLSQEEIELLATNLLDLKLTITGSKGFDFAQTSSGGISLKDINLKTMESKNESNLYFTGEILDVDGKCGGYNLTFAFLTAILVGNHLRSKND